MKPRATARLPWVLFAIAVVIFAAAAALSLAAHHPSAVLPFLPALLVFGGVGAVVASRRPANALGWLMLGMSGMSIGLVADAYAQYGMSRTPHAMGTAWAAWTFIISIEVGTVPLIFTCSCSLTESCPRLGGESSPGPRSHFPSSAASPPPSRT